MRVLLTLLAVAGVTWLFRISFTAVLAGDRLPPAVSARMDAVSPAAFAALLATELSGTSLATAPAMLAAVVAAAVTAWTTRSHLKAVLAAAAAWSVVSLLL